MQKSITWYTVKNGKIDRIQITREGEKPVPENLEWVKSPTNNVIHPETPVERYDEKMRYLSDEEWLKKQGRKDPRGRWYHKGREKPEVEIYSEDALPPGDDYTKEQPIENEPYQYFDEKKNRFVVDVPEKEKAEKAEKRAKVQAIIDKAEADIRRSEIAIAAKDANEDDLKKFNELYSLIKETREKNKDLLKKETA
jgi:hypothetical protein